MKIGFEEKWRLPAEVERGEEHPEPPQPVQYCWVIGPDGEALGKIHGGAATKSWRCYSNRFPERNTQTAQIGRVFVLSSPSFVTVRAGRLQSVSVNGAPQRRRSLVEGGSTYVVVGKTW